ncbi:RNA polymerase sigma factor [Aliamphritea hakodatensis]|uniref:RNA polymerase sigma factor n=1 Tax=Aliamphritea hakodatensis TaxID=2895352 RepID=UPI0022FD9F3F|nr:sigma-70 family RNA polymerase sigma factor [Aliamphritea hakodatensis]
MIDQAQLNRLHRYAVSLCRHGDDAFDLVQSALASFLEPPVKQFDDPIPYLFTSIRNRYIDIYRRDQKVQNTPLQDEHREAADYDLQVLETVMVNERQVHYLMNMLDDQEREMLFLWAVEGYSTQEVATLMALPKGTVLSKIHRLRQRLHQSKARENNCGVSL